MKTGDIVYCKKSYTFQGGKFLMGSKYKLDHVNVLPATSKYESYVILYTGFQLWMVKLSMNDFKSHFFTISEHRRLKLEKLENWR